MPTRPPSIKATQLRALPTASTPRHYDTRRWRRLSAAKRAAAPVCEVCGEEPSQHVHHVKPLDCGGRDEWNNLQAVCLRCHNEIQPEADRAVPPPACPGGGGVQNFSPVA